MYVRLRIQKYIIQELGNKSVPPSVARGASGPEQSCAASCTCHRACARARAILFSDRESVRGENDRDPMPSLERSARTDPCRFAGG